MTDGFNNAAVNVDCHFNRILKRTRVAAEAANSLLEPGLNWDRIPVIVNGESLLVMLKFVTTFGEWSCKTDAQERERAFSIMAAAASELTKPLSHEGSPR